MYTSYRGPTVTTARPAACWRFANTVGGQPKHLLVELVRRCPVARATAEISSLSHRRYVPAV